MKGTMMNIGRQIKHAEVETLATLAGQKAKITALEMELSHCRESHAVLETLAREVVKRASAAEDTRFWEWRGIMGMLGMKAKRALGMME